ncbi:MAG: hypothetical protein JW862_11255 [Anaerolineales bacterium]|nr:hypothetical protein [Anaerolineales bacterium]
MKTIHTCYEIRVKGHLTTQWSEWFDDLDITQENNDTLLSGVITDQSALHGLLKKVRDLGLVLVSVKRISDHE